MTTWNPRYIAYGKANGVDTPEEMLKVDRERWPGGAMVGFMLWLDVNRRALQAKLKLGRHAFDLYTCRHPGAFDEFVASKEAVAPILP